MSPKQATDVMFVMKKSLRISCAGRCGRVPCKIHPVKHSSVTEVAVAALFVEHSPPEGIVASSCGLGYGAGAAELASCARTLHQQGSAPCMSLRLNPEF